MPHIIQTTENANAANITEMRSMGKLYKYSKGHDFTPWSVEHEQLVTKIMQRAQTSSEKLAARFESWNKIDETMTTFVDLSTTEKNIQNQDHRKPVSLIYPYTYAIHETILGYLLAVFNQKPIFRYEGVSPEDTIGAILLEKAIEQHCEKSRIILNLHTQFSDSLKYGFGIVGTGWNVQKGWKIAANQTIDAVGNPTRGKKKQTWKTVYEGNELFNIDPYLTLPDPNIALGNAQKGEFFGWVERNNRLVMQEDEDNGVDDYFNVKYLVKVKNFQSTIYNRDDSGRNKKAETSEYPYNTSETNEMDIIHMYIRLIPSEWKLSDSDRPELWKVAVAADSVLIQAHQVKLAHNQIPIGLCSPDFDGYSSTPISRMEVLYGLQHYLDWNLSSHITNVRKAVNDQFIVDPSMINVPDLRNPKAGGIIRLRKSAFGQGVNDAIKQLPIHDVTQGHMIDTKILTDAIDQISGADSAMQGSLRQSGPERLTKGEFQGTQQGGFTRMERIANVIAIQSMQPIGEQFASNCQQFMDEELWAKTNGRWQDTLMNSRAVNVQDGKLKISPMDILINYDVQVRDGVIPGSNFPPVWGQLFEIIAQSEQLQQEFSLSRIFTHIAENSGVKDVSEFKIKSDEQVAQQVQAGNIVPQDEFNNQ